MSNTLKEIKNVEEHELYALCCNDNVVEHGLEVYGIRSIGYKGHSNNSLGEIITSSSIYGLFNTMLKYGFQELGRNKQNLEVYRVGIESTIYEELIAIDKLPCEDVIKDYISFIQSATRSEVDHPDGFMNHLILKYNRILYNDATATGNLRSFYPTVKFNNLPLNIVLNRSPISLKDFCDNYFQFVLEHNKELELKKFIPWNSSVTVNLNMRNSYRITDIEHIGNFFELFKNFVLIGDIGFKTRRKT